MQEKPQGDQFIPEAIDEQVAQLKQGSRRDAANARLVRDLERAYREELAEEQAIERIRERLLMRATKTSSSDEQATQLLAIRSKLPRRKGIERMNTPTERANRHVWTRRWGVLAAAVITTLVVGSLVAVLQIAQIARTNHNSGDASVGSSKEQTTAKKSAPPVTNPGMYLGVGSQVVKFDMQTKKIVWRFVVKSDPNDLPAFQQPQVNAPPVVAGDNVYFTALDGKLYTLNAQTGKLHWERNFKAYVGQIAVVDGVLYTNTDWSDEKGTINDVYALNPADGTTKTKYKTPGVIEGIFDGVIYLTGYQKNGNTLTAIKVTDGSQLWQTQIDAKQNFGQVYVKNGRLYTFSSHVSEKTANEPQDSYVYTIDLQSGKITWKSPMMDGFVFNSAVGDDGRIYCGAQNHYVYAFDPRLRMNKELWKYHTIVGHVYPAPIVQDGVVYVGQSSAGDNNGNDDHLVALDAATGKQKWATPLKGYTGAGDDKELMLHDGVIYLSTGFGVRGFATDSGKEVVTIPTDRLFSKKDAGDNGFVMGIAITIVS